MCACRVLLIRAAGERYVSYQDENGNPAGADGSERGCRRTDGRMDGTLRERLAAEKKKSAKFPLTVLCVCVCVCVTDS